MKKWMLILSLLVFSNASFSQYTFAKAVKLYYRVNPFDRKFSVVLNDILTDPTFVKMEMYKRTDSSFFFLSGYYKQFNPFDFVSKQTQVRLAETEIVFDDSLNITDTIIIYQVLGMAGPGEENKIKVQKELSRFHKRYSYDFSRSEYRELANDSIPTAGLYNYYVNNRRTAALTAAWGMMPGEDNYIFTLTLKLKIRENFADIPIAPDESWW